ncbi:hypothetical protein [Bacillus weihaiensis]|uniref:Uncharacterized protein n=1 Tax=Bacillus weihaiensis TaxID=1547283 RepID=A0A1L3MTP7_9BACI|nr:hypothetical protein [Bacillus weihaiensis]APH05715.1 hypothetical protein A9C19_13790 [Bacillus weihaiensis]
MDVVLRLKEFIVNQDIIPKTMNIHPDALKELEEQKYVYSISSDNYSTKRFMGIELVESDEVDVFDIKEEDTRNERWIVKREVKKIREKYIHEEGELSKDISLLFAYLGYLERELEDKTNYVAYLKELEYNKKMKEEKA